MDDLNRVIDSMINEITGTQPNNMRLSACQGKSMLFVVDASSLLVSMTNRSVFMQLTMMKIRIKVEQHTEAKNNPNLGAILMHLRMNDANVGRTIDSTDSAMNRAIYRNTRLSMRS